MNILLFANHDAGRIIIVFVFMIRFLIAIGIITFLIWFVIRTNKEFKLLHFKLDKFSDELQQIKQSLKPNERKEI
jgi:hypothetical protein